MMSNTIRPEHAYETIDAAYASYLQRNPALAERWLLAQTLHSGQSRRGILNLLPIPNGARVLDIGTGFGALAMDVAALKSARIDAVDVDRHTLEVARLIYSEIRELNAFPDGAEIRFQEGNVYDLEYQDATFDFVVARYVYQHLHDPTSATNEIKRVLQPGGYVCLIDIDDAYTLTYPDDTGVFDKLQVAFRRLQEMKGGDRFVGRKLASFLHTADLDVIGTIIQPEAQFARADHEDQGMLLTMSRLRDVKREIVEHGIMSRDDYDSCVNAFELLSGQWSFHTNGQVVALGRRP